MVLKKRIINVIWILLISFLITSCTPFSNLLFGPMGSITIETYPSGVSIWIDGKDTGLNTPDTIENLTKGEHEVKLEYGDIEYIETVIVYNKQDTYLYKELISKSELWKITVTPPEMYLQIGQIGEIDKITASYIGGPSKEISLSSCIVTWDSDCIEISSNGKISGISKGGAAVKISYTENGITESFDLIVYVDIIPVEPEEEPEDEIEYRALLVGVGDYVNDDGVIIKDLDAPPYDVEMIEDTLNHSGESFSIINKIIDLQATKNAILNGIASTFSQADSNDISYFFFSGHGMLNEGISYLCPTDLTLLSPLSDFISISELESALGAIPGPVVVILNSCHSGGFIGKEINRGNIENYSNYYNNCVINSFIKEDFSKDLANSKFRVLTSCLSTQGCVGIPPILPGDNPFGLFTRVLCKGCGYDYYSHPYYADENENGEITLNETYFYTDKWVSIFSDQYNATHTDQIDQDTQVYPANSSFVIIKE